jgi:hypothetical protein
MPKRRKIETKKKTNQLERLPIFLIFFLPQTNEHEKLCKSFLQRTLFVSLETFTSFLLFLLYVLFFFSSIQPKVFCYQKHNKQHIIIDLVSRHLGRQKIQLILDIFYCTMHNNTHIVIKIIKSFYSFSVFFFRNVIKK